MGWVIGLEKMDWHPPHLPPSHPLPLENLKMIGFPPPPHAGEGESPYQMGTLTQCFCLAARGTTTSAGLSFPTSSNCR